MPRDPKSTAQPPPDVNAEDPRLIPLSVKARTRMVSFRLTQEEHQRYHKICLALGVPGFSELVRIAIDNFVQHSCLISPGGTIESRLSEIESCLRVLTGEIQQLRNNQSPSAN